MRRCLPLSNWTPRDTLEAHVISRVWLTTPAGNYVIVSRNASVCDSKINNGRPRTCHVVCQVVCGERNENVNK